MTTLVEKRYVLFTLVSVIEVLIIIKKFKCFTFITVVYPTRMSFAFHVLNDKKLSFIKCSIKFKSQIYLSLLTNKFCRYNPMIRLKYYICGGTLIGFMP